MLKIKMDKELLHCLLCKGCFDESQHVPVALPACGHTFCRLCLVRMRDISDNSAFSCPTCRKEHWGPAPENLPCNWVILNLLNTSHKPKEKDEQSKKTQDNDERSKKTQDSDDDPSNNKMPPSDSSTKSKVWKGVGFGLAATAGAACLVAAAPVALTVAGFTSSGIASGSLAASMMSSAAIANGGGVAAGSLVAVLQSAGAAGIGASATTCLASAGAFIGAGAAKIFHSFKSNDNEASHAGAGESYKTDDDDGKGDDKDGKVDDKDSEVDDKDSEVDDKDSEGFGKGDDDKDSSGDEDDKCYQV